MAIKAKRGGWRAVIHYRDAEGKAKRHTRTGFATKYDAKQYEIEYSRARLLGHTIEPVRTTFQHAFDKYLEHNSASVDTRTLKMKKAIFDKWYKPIANYRIQRITINDIMRIVNRIKSSNYSYSYKNKLIGVFKSSLKYCNDYLHTNYNLALITPQKKTSDAVRLSYDVWSVDEFNQFIEHIEEEPYKTLFILLYRTGLRRGEALALTKADYDPVKKAITVSKSMTHTHPHPQKLKTPSSKRIVLLDDDTASHVAKLMKGYRTHYLFGANRPVSFTTLERRFKSAIKASGVKRIRIHDLRHSHATNLINNGANIVAVSKRLGHSDISMTLKVYTHLLEKTEYELLKLIET